MKEHPLIFSAESVRGILAKTKTQTRRVIQPQPDSIRQSVFVPSGFEDRHGQEIRCRYQPGDVCWIRETWASSPFRNSIKSSELIKFIDMIEYSATYPNKSHYYWRSPLFMPRWASRITLRLLDVRIQRVNEISEEEAIAEGVTMRPNSHVALYDSNGAHMENGWSMDWSQVGTISYGKVLEERNISLGTAKNAYANLWDSLNAKRGYPFDSGVWVYALTFEVIS